MPQPSLFTDPIWHRTRQMRCMVCDGPVEIGEPVDRGRCVQTPWRCTKCGTSGEISEKKQR